MTRPTPVGVPLVAVLLATVLGLSCGRTPAEPPSFDVVEKTIPELQDALESGEVTSRELVEQYLARIAAYDQVGPAINAMISLSDHARDEADALDEERSATGPRGPLHGIPVVVKDNYDALGLPTTAGSIALAQWYPPDDAFQVAKLRSAGAIILGKANMHEFAYGMTTVSSLGGQTRNPYNTARHPGGSSGGTGAAVAANYAAAGMGTDTCGSIRMPSFHHALVGLRGTRGLSSRDGIVPLALTQDMGGPLTKTVTDLAIVLDATVGSDPADAETAKSTGHIPDTYTAYLREDALRGARIGLVDWLVGDAPEDEPVAEVIDAALAEIETAGGEVVEIALTGASELVEAPSLASTEFPRQLADYLATPGTPVKSLDEILALGLYHAAVEDRYLGAREAGGYDDPEYLSAVAQRGPLRELVTQAFEDMRLDAIAYPTLRRVASHIGDPQRGNNCALSAKSGLPAIVVPAGYVDNGMPVGLELLGPAWSEGELIALAYAFEQRTHHRRPPRSTPRLTDEHRLPVEWRIPDTDDATRTPPVVTARFSATWNPDRREARYAASVYGVRDDEVLFMDLHRGGPGEVGPVEVTLARAGGARASGVIRLSAAQSAAFETGHLYFDVHTTAHPAGVARLEARVAQPDAADLKR